MSPIREEEQLLRNQVEPQRLKIKRQVESLQLYSILRLVKLDWVGILKIVQTRHAEKDMKQEQRHLRPPRDWPAQRQPRRNQSLGEALRIRPSSQHGTGQLNSVLWRGTPPWEDPTRFGNEVPPHTRLKQQRTGGSWPSEKVQEVVVGGASPRRQAMLGSVCGPWSERPQSRFVL